MVLFVCPSDMIMSMHHAADVDLNNNELESSKKAAEAKAEKAKSLLSSAADNSNNPGITVLLNIPAPVI